jgi:hypothetical protein
MVRFGSTRMGSKPQQAMVHSTSKYLLLLSCLISSIVTICVMRIMSSTATVKYSSESFQRFCEKLRLYNSSNNNNDFHYDASDSKFDYVPSTVEEYVYSHAKELGLQATQFRVSGCYLWGDAATQNGANLQPTDEEKKQLKVVPPHIRQQYLEYKQYLKEYNKYVSSTFHLNLPQVPVDSVGSSKYSNPDDNTKRFTDLRHALRYHSQDTVCDAVRVPYETIFKSTTTTGIPKNGRATSLLSRIEGDSRRIDANGTGQYMEPLLPPLRHLDICDDREAHLYDMTYIVHDFHHICRTFTPYTRTVFIDMGASLLFHVGTNPIVAITTMYEQFGIQFDHIYAYERTPYDSNQMNYLFNIKLPDRWKAAYHWINTGVDPKVDAKLNPFTLIKQHFSPDDFVVVKLDIDTPLVELSLAQQLLKDTELHALVDQFYFEYHVVLKELPEWDGGDSIYDALHLLTQMREKGIAAHFWV